MENMNVQLESSGSGGDSDTKPSKSIFVLAMDLMESLLLVVHGTQSVPSIYQATSFVCVLVLEKPLGCSDGHDRL